MKKNIQRIRQRTLHGSTVLVWCLALLALSLVFPSSSKGQTSQEVVTGQETTPNQLPTMSDFTRSGGTKTNSGSGCATGTFCTAGKQGPGGTFSTTFDLQESMSIDQINRGFEMDYGMDVRSHVSNSTLASCVGGNVMQAADCRDIFKLTVSLFGSGVLAHKFEHEVELDYSGTRNFAFSQTIPENTFTSLTGEFDMFGIDAGFPNKFFGPRFASPFLTTTFDLVTIIETEIIDVLNTTDILDTNVPESVEITNIEVEVESPAGQQMATLEMEVQTEMTMEMPAEMAPPTETTVEPEIEVAEVNTEIEAEMQNEPTTSESPVADNSESDGESQGGTESSTEPEPEPTETAGEEPRNTETASSEETEESQSESSSVKHKAKVTKKTSAKKKAAIKIVNKMGDKGKYDSTNQMKTLIVMTVLGNSKQFFAPAVLPDTAGFFTDTKLPDAQLPENNAAAWLLMGGSNQLHDELVNSQYK